MKALIIMLFISAQCISVLALHPTHMSVVNMDINSDSLQIKYAIRLFQDDVNLLINSIYHKELFHSTEPFDVSQNAYKIDNYFLEHFKLKSDQLALNPILIKKESTETDYCLYYIVNLPEIPDSIYIENNILVDFYSNQTNLLIFSYKNIEKGVTFNADNQSQYINLDNN